MWWLVRIQVEHPVQRLFANIGELMTALYAIPSVWKKIPRLIDGLFGDERAQLFASGLLVENDCSSFSRKFAMYSGLKPRPAAK
jgi:hypothetical protein